MGFMKKLLFSLLFIAASLTANAYDYPYLAFEKSDGTVTTVAVESLTMTVSGGQLVATNGDGSLSFTLSELSKMYFSSTPTGISDVAAAGEEEVEVFSVSGMSLGKYATASDATRACKTMKQGIYVLKSKSNVLKIAVK